MTFTIIIPCYNAAKTILDCVNSALRQSVTTEIIIVDDCSTDGTWDIIKALEKTFSNIRCARTVENGGPGRARNIGLFMAKGDWILFLDADDTMESDATIQLAQFIREGGDCDAVGFDWRYDDNNIGGRTDQHIFYDSKSSLMREYLSLRTDGSVIYTAVKRSLIEERHIRFPECQHEDVEFIFKVYWFAHKMRYLDCVLYCKHSTTGSVVNTISVYHVEGFMGVWKRIGEFLEENDSLCLYRKYYDAGCYAALATRVREIYRMHGGIAIYKALYNLWFDNFRAVLRPNRQTKYVKMAMNFLQIMQSENTDEIKFSDIEWFMDDIVGRSWSCYDLHHSLFLAPDEVRTCCKRFFWKGRRRGDVVLSRDMNDNFIKAKWELYHDINSGKRTPCDGCPFLEFKEWESMGIEYLSLEYHSVCNLKCSYCSDAFNGGKQPSYDVEKLIAKIPESAEISTVLWGGGEPTLGKYFNPMALIERFPEAQHRILTNSVEHSDIVESLLKENLVHITTSLDAATRETFKTVRGKDAFLDTFLNIDKYAKANPRRVTIKYILTNDNSSADEILMFSVLVKSYEWQKCNFQISCDFNYEHFKSSTVQDIHSRLVRAGCDVVFVDDLLRMRMGKTASGDKALSHEPVVIWGAGAQARLLFDNTSFFRRNPLQYFVDESKVGERMSGFGGDVDVMAPEVLLRDDFKIVIAAVQGYPLIYDRMVKMGIENRLIKELIL